MGRWGGVVGKWWWEAMCSGERAVQWQCVCGVCEAGGGETVCRWCEGEAAVCEKGVVSVC